jgi:hypothetical protein
MLVNEAHYLLELKLWTSQVKKESPVQSTITRLEERKQRRITKKSKDKIRNSEVHFISSRRQGRQAWV